jgi:hypothetical protein
MAVAAAQLAGFLAQAANSATAISAQKLLGQMQLPEYDPRTHNAELWFYRLEQYLGLFTPRPTLRPTSEDIVTVANLKLCGAALDW